jgi:hypothetical protein
MKRCPNCQSRKFYGNRKLGFVCRNCGFKNIPQSILSTLQKAKCDGGITNEGIESHIITNSSLFQEMHDLHNKAYKFRITRDNPNLQLQRIEGFDGKLYIINYNGFKIRKSSKWLIIYKNGRNKVPLKNLDKTSLHILEGMKNLALEIADKYKFEIDAIPLSFSKNRPEVKTPFLSANNFYEDEAKAVYPVPSPIELQGKNAVPNAINLSAMLEDFRIVMEKEIQNKQLHQEVLEHMDKTLGKIEDKIDMPVKFKTWYGETVKIKPYVPAPKGVTDKNDMVGLWSAILERTKPQLDDLRKVFGC